MGIVIKQSIKNTIITFIGFGIGAVNTLFMYPYFLGEDYFGLSGYVLSAANILYPILSFGIQNTLIKFFNENKHFHQIYGNPAFYHAKDARPHLKIVHLKFVFYPGLVPPYLAPTVQ